MAPKTTEDTTKAIATINVAFDDLVATRSRLLTKREGLIARAQLLKAMPLSLAEVKSLVLMHIEAAGRQYPALAGLPDFLDSLQRPRGQRPDLMFGASAGATASHNGPINTLDHAALQHSLQHGAGPFRSLVSKSGAGFFHNPAHSPTGTELARFEEARFCFFFPDQVAAKICSYLESNFKPPYVPAGLSDSDAALGAADRMHEIRQIEAKVGELDAEIKGVDEQMVALPVARKERREAAFRLNIRIDEV